MCQQQPNCLSNTLVFTLGTLVGLSLTGSVNLMDLHTISVVGFAAVSFYIAQKFHSFPLIKNTIVSKKSQ
jgi:hypothetical protein